MLAPLLADPQPLEVVVVVDGGRDGSLELLERMAAGDARLRPLWIENRGVVGARAAGAEAARGEVVVLLDDDVFAMPGLIAGHARHHAEPGLVIVGYMPVARPPRPRPGDYPRELYAREY